MSSARNSRTIGLGLVVLGGVMAIAGASVPWYGAYIKGQRQGTFSGADITGGVAQALAVAILAGALLMLALRSTGRRVVAVLLAAMAIVAGVTMPFQRPARTEVITELRKHTLDSGYHLGLTGGNIGYLVGCLVVLAGAVIVVLRAHHWPQRADRFERRAATARAAVLTDDPDADIDTGAVWKSIDAGLDPTIAPDEDPGGGSAEKPEDDPDRIRRGDTRGD